MAQRSRARWEIPRTGSERIRFFEALWGAIAIDVEMTLDDLIRQGWPEAEALQLVRKSYAGWICGNTRDAAFLGSCRWLNGRAA